MEYITPYKEETQIKKRKKLEELYEMLPDFCKKYFIAKENRLSAVTAVSYAYNLVVFFEYLQKTHPQFKCRSVQTYELKELEILTSDDIAAFAHYMRQHVIEKEINGKKIVKTNKDATIDHYLSALSALWNHYIQTRQLEYNPVIAVPRSDKRSKKKKVIRLEGNEKEKVLSSTQYGTGLSSKQQKYHEKNKVRDTAIIKVFLDTGIRISELVGLDIDHINFEEHSLFITRKGSGQDEVYMSDDAEMAIKEYLEIRHQYVPIDSENALFLNRDGYRLSERSVEKLTKKYVTAAGLNKKDVITPHKLRSTYASDMLAAIGDIELVSEQLGHASLNTTKIYAEYDKQKKKDVRNVLHEMKPRDI